VIVRCPNCGTEFGFDDRQVGEGVTVRCSVCKHVFKVVSTAAAAAPATGWQIRTTDNANFTANDVATLREWISEGRLTPEDEVSRTGRNWMRLGEMPEFGDLFRGQTGEVGPVGVIKPVAPYKPGVAVVQPLSKVQPPAPPLQPSRPAVPPPTTASDHPLPRAVPPADKPASVSPASLVAGGAPQSQRLTMSPPRSSPKPSAAPIADLPSDDDEVLIDEEVEEDNQLAASESPTSSRSTRSRSASTPARTPAPVADGDEDEFGPTSQPEPDESIEAPRRSGGLGFIAGVAVLALVGVGVVFGVPQIRERIFGAPGVKDPTDGSQGPAGPAAARPEIAAAEAATHSLGTAALAQAEAGLQRAIDAGDADAATQAAMKVALAELLLSRALAYQIAAAIDEGRRDDFRSRANDDREDGERLIDGLEGFADVDRLAKVRALARLAAGRAEVEVAPLVPAGATETKLIVQGAVLWQNLTASVPEGLLPSLQALPKHSGLSQSTLGLALLRAGDTTAARNTAERLMGAVGSDEQVVAQAIRTHLGPEQGGPTEVGATAGTEGETEGDQGEIKGDEGGTVAKPPPPPDEEGGGDGGGGGGGGGGGNSFERLIDRGCEQVSSGDADAGIKTLQKAFNINPKDVDVLVCLADGYAAQGSNHHANQFYERALEQSPTNKGALRGAAKAAAKTGATDRAIDLYERLLKVDPNNAVALAYIANNKPGGAEPSDSGTPAPEGGG
jgi:predicted Zn finger-like uncharacterized protein